MKTRYPTELNCGGRIFTSSLHEEERTVLAITLIGILAVLLLVSLPVWRHSRSWGYYPCIGVGVALLAVINLAVKGHL